ncbi:Cyclin-dependent kinases regulatory subunit 1 [Zea mays]|uniref:Cyclin-dependent kinases regulatory subunit n=1 Tax=Zea mays TaxID=4577 RepID=A0A1D6H2Z1_MAIZE|nr:Cyclin-dependent kinases regulatory subunit 1 [Zea mays]
MVCAYHSILGDHGLHTSSLHPLPRDASLPPFASIHHSRGRKEPAPPLQRTKPDPPPPSPSHVSQHALAATLARHSSAKTASAPRGVDREALVDMGQIKYSEKYFNDTYEYRILTLISCLYMILVLPPEVAKLLPKNRLLSENEWRAIGVQQSRGSVHYAIHHLETHIMLFRRRINYQQQ